MFFEVHLIAALGERTRAIGKNNDLLWHDLKPDMRRFKELTTGHPVIMGWNTWVSLPQRFRPLANRTNIVLRSNELAMEDAVACSSLEMAFACGALYPGGEKIFVIGGERVYREALQYATVLDLTFVDDDTPGDRFFPHYGNSFRVVEEVSVPFQPKLNFVTLWRK